MDLQTYLNNAPRGEAANLSRELNEHPSNLSAWKTGKKPIPPYKCVLLENITGGLVTRKELRPNDYEKHWPELVT